MVRQLQYGSKTFTELCNESPFKFKASFLRYLTYCQDMGFIKKTEKDGTYQPYVITPKGAALLDLFVPPYDHISPIIL